MDDLDSKEVRRLRKRLQPTFVKFDSHTHTDIGMPEYIRMIQEDVEIDGFWPVVVQIGSWIKTKPFYINPGDFNRTRRLKFRGKSLKESKPEERVVIEAPDRIWVLDSSQIINEEFYYGADGPGHFWRKGFWRFEQKAD